MLREELLEKLELVAPALAKNDLVPVLRYFWFKEGVVLAYNDQIAIQTKLASGFIGAVPNTLVSLLKASRAKDVEFSETAKGQLVLKASSAKFKLPFLPDEATDIFKMPELDPKRALPVDMEVFLEAIESCMLSLKEDPSMPDSLGITIDTVLNKVNKTVLQFTSTNDATISHTNMLTKDNIDNFRVVLSGSFCRQMLVLAKLSDKKYLEINDGFSLFECGGTVLFGRLVDIQRPLDFDLVLKQSIPENYQKIRTDIPTKLELMLDRACIIGNKTQISIEKGIARFVSKSDKGEVYDSVQLESNHPDTSVCIDPNLFRKGHGKFDKMLLTENCLIMTKGTSIYLVSSCSF